MIYMGSWVRLRRNEATILFLRGSGQGSEIFKGVVARLRSKGATI